MNNYWDRLTANVKDTISSWGSSQKDVEAKIELFMKIKKKFCEVDPVVAKQLGGIYLFCVMKKQEVKYWTMDLNKVVIYPGEPEDDQEADATFTMTDEVLEQLASGRAQARHVVQAGKCSVTGDIMRAMKLEPYLKM